MRYGKEKHCDPDDPDDQYQVPPQALNYATVHKTREKGRVEKIDFRVIFGTVAAVTAAGSRALRPRPPG